MSNEATPRKVRGSTAEERRQARRKLTADRRALFYRGRLQEAGGNPADQLRHACEYVRAIGDDLPPGEAAALAREVAELADRWRSR
jgi:hypothetical protein